MGPSIRGKSPIIANEKVIGVVSVGYLQDDIEKEVSSIQRKIVLIISFILVGGLLVAFFISFNIKKAILGLEPKEIAWMFQEKHAILESIHEGIIAIDVHGKITIVNETAHKILHIPKDVMLRGQKIEEVITHTHLLDVVSTARAEYDQEFMIDGEVFGKPDPHFEWTGGNHRCRCKFEK